MISGAWNLSTLEKYDSDIFFFFRWNQHFWCKNLANSTRAILTHFWKLSYYQYSWVRLTKCFKFWVFRKRSSQCILCRGFEPSSKDNPPSPYMAILSFLYFPERPPPLLARLLRQYFPIEIPDKHENKLMWQSYFFIFKD